MRKLLVKLYSFNLTFITEISHTYYYNFILKNTYANLIKHDKSFV